MNVRVRTADQLRDARAIASLHVASWRSSYRGILPQAYLDRMSVSALTARWRKRLNTRANPHRDKADLWLVERHNRAAGFSLIGPCTDDPSLIGFAGEVIMLYLHPTEIGHGLGRVLLTHSLDVLAARGYYWAVVWVLEHNLQARGFYHRMGLRPDGAMRWDRFASREVPVLRYAKPLNPVVDFDALTAR